MAITVHLRSTEQGERRRRRRRRRRRKVY